MALIFSLPLVLCIFVVYRFFPEWYAKFSQISEGTFVVILAGAIITTVFFAYFRMHYKWETNEQLYLELKAREKADS